MTKAKVRFLLAFHTVEKLGSYSLSVADSKSPICLPIRSDLIGAYAQFEKFTADRFSMDVPDHSDQSLKGAAQALLETHLADWSIDSSSNPWNMNSCWSNTNQKWEKCIATPGLAFKLIFKNKQPWFSQVAGDGKSSMVVVYLVLVVQPLP